MTLAMDAGMGVDRTAGSAIRVISTGATARIGTGTRPGDAGATAGNAKLTTDLHG